MKIAIFSTKEWVREAFDRANKKHHMEFSYLEPRLNIDTVGLAAGHDAVCLFANDSCDAEVIASLQGMGVRTIALRCAGFNNVDVRAASAAGITVVRVPAYSPYSVAEHAVGLIMVLNRRYHRAYNRVREGNFSLDGLMGFDIRGKTVGVVGTGQIGRVFCGIMAGFSTRLLAYDLFPNEELASTGVEYVALERLFAEADIISLHCPLTRDTHHVVDRDAIATMKPGVTLINTSRGALIDSVAAIEGLKQGQIGNLGLDVYEEEEDLFFEDLSGQVIQDDVFVRLQTFPNVLITAHQAFFTTEAVTTIAETTLENLATVHAGRDCANRLVPEKVYGT
ncbi:MAG: 2-hydroxyacid dehydrogenase [Spirochaetaceae bacterium]|nr:MAG: 2-hydroxyacid dehydrogenase [Spirochaetaceae bacterium]